MEVIIAGSRNFTEYSVVKSCLDAFFEGVDLSIVTIFSGCAKGADSLGERYARANNISLKPYPAKWKTYGSLAGKRRNVEMGLDATHLIAFWDKKSRGTYHMITFAGSVNLHITVVTVYPHLKNVKFKELK